MLNEIHLAFYFQLYSTAPHGLLVRLSISITLVYQTSPLVSNVHFSSTSMFNPFSRAPRGGAAWFNAGPVSAYPDNTSDDGPLGQQRQCNDAFKPGCKVFHVPKEDATQASPVGIDDWKDGEGDTKDQVMVFRYGGKFVAVNHVSSHLILVLWPRRVHLVTIFLTLSNVNQTRMVHIVIF